MGTFKHPISGRARHGSMNSLCHVQTFAANAHIRSGWWQAAAIPFLFCELTNTKLISGAIPSKAKFNSLIATVFFFFLSCKLLFVLSLLLHKRPNIWALTTKRGRSVIFVWQNYSPPLHCAAGTWIRKVFGRILCRKSDTFKVDSDDKRGR